MRVLPSLTIVHLNPNDEVKITRKGEVITVGIYEGGHQTTAVQLTINMFGKEYAKRVKIEEL